MSKRRLTAYHVLRSTRNAAFYLAFYLIDTFCIFPKTEVGEVFYRPVC
jgi:hypothetical protein